jgi:Ca2+-binding RTX toxin-like protein
MESLMNALATRLFVTASIAQGAITCAVALAVGALAALPHPAAASTVSVTGSGSNKTFTYTAGTGEANVLEIARELPGEPNEEWRIFDPGAVIVPGPGCEVRPSLGIWCQRAASAVIDLKDLDDTIQNGPPPVSAQVFGGEGKDLLTGSDEADTLSGGPGNDEIRDGLGADTTGGGAGDDLFFNFGGADDIIGGEDEDTVAYGERSGVSRTAPVSASLDGLANDGETGEGDDIGSDVENLIGGNGNDVLVGDDDANELSGDFDGYYASGSDQLDGRGGADVLVGGGGDGDVLTGGSGDDDLLDERGSTTLNGGTGADRLRAPVGSPQGSVFAGGDGTDTLTYELNFFPVDVTLNGAPDDGGPPGGPQGTDDVESDVENLIGTDDADRLVGSDAANTLDGNGGADVLQGQGGRDTADFSRRTTPVEVTLDGVSDDGEAADGANVGVDIEDVVGGASNDTLTGSSGQNGLYGGPGEDTLDGGSGPDLLDGGLGDDLVDYSGRQMRVTVDLDDAVGDDGQAGETDTVMATENARTGSGDDDLTGNGADNVLDGGPGGDVMRGLAGTDRVNYSSRSGPVVADLDGEPADDGESGEHDSLAADLEELSGGSADDWLIGNGLANMLSGGAGDDVLDGDLGADILEGGSGNDVGDYSTRDAGVNVDLDGESGDDGEPGEADTAGSDIEDIWGGSGGDQLTGNASDNLIDGGLGADRLSGLGGFDAADYSQRAAAVTVDLDGQAGDDGEAGEGDGVMADIEDLLGGTGNDTLIGDGAENFLIGGAGDDQLEGGGGEDLLDAGAGDDNLRSRDGEIDDDLCGDGRDVAVADADDVVQACESVELPTVVIPPMSVLDKLPPPASARFRRTIELLGALRRGLSGTVRSGEAGTVLATAEVSPRTARALGLLARRRVVVARGRAVVRRPGTTRLTLRFTTRAKRKLRRARRVPLTVRIVVRDRAGNATALVRKVTLKRRRR